ncbi:MAG: UDP-N-acetylmuramate dehydrogenase [Halioglobus sp.]|nr:UDP-N-acetylmuramate dehydrogenase [Halioglobus sp.]
MKLYHDKLMYEHNTLALHARADTFACVTNDAELLEALAWARTAGVDVVVLGQGSNIILAGDVQALVVQQAVRGIEVLDASDTDVILRVAAGENWHKLVQWTLQNGYYGLENLALIPGTVGASPIQNIGAYGVELHSLLLRVHARRIADDKPVTLDNAACQFGYRDSVFKRECKDQLVITAIDIKLSRRPSVNIGYPALAAFFADRPHIEPTPQAVFDAVVGIRSSKLPDPSVEPNAGSFFKNPSLRSEAAARLLAKHPDLPCFSQGSGSVKVSAAWLIEQCGWKGHRAGDQGVHPQHALVLVNYGSGSGAQLLTLANKIVASVYEKFGVALEIEPRIYGFNL